MLNLTPHHQDKFPPLLAHAGIFALFTALAVAFTWPLALQLTTHVPGVTGDDNLVFIWNQWWMRKALASPGVSFFSSDYLFVPTGTSIVLHSHTALNAFLGATLFSELSPATALNVTLVLNAILTGFFAYLLAFHVSRDRVASVIAGAGFACSASMSAHLFGAFNYHAAWGLPLFALMLLRAFERGTTARRLAAGAALGLLVYLDYYYTVYSIILVGLVLFQRWFDPGIVLRPCRPFSRLGSNVILGVAVAAAAAATVIAYRGGTSLTLGSWTLSMRSGMNLRGFATLGFVVWLWRVLRPGLRFDVSFKQLTPDLKLLAAVSGTSLLVAAPVLIAAVNLWFAGDYVSQRYLWRSIPAGADLTGVVLGNPFNSLWGPFVQWFYSICHITLDGPAWLGVGGVIVFVCWRALRVQVAAHIWIAIVLFFGLWALGPWLTVLGINTGMPMPQMLIRYVPIASNARLPANAIMMVHLAICVLTALALARYQAVLSTWAKMGLLVLVLADAWSAPIATYRLEVPKMYDVLRDEPAGAVLELPLGLRDGFGGVGLFESLAMFYQTIHEKPIVGGYISRLPASVQAAYRDSPVLTRLMSLSQGDGPDASESPVDPIGELLALGVRYIVVDSANLNNETRRFVDQLNLTFLAGDKTRRLYRVRN